MNSMKYIIAISLAALALSGCNHEDNSTPFQARLDNGYICIGNYSYVVGMDGSYTPSPTTADGFEDFDCEIAQ